MSQEAEADVNLRPLPRPNQIGDKRRPWRRDDVPVDRRSGMLERRSSNSAMGGLTGQRRRADRDVAGPARALRRAPTSACHQSTVDHERRLPRP
jgi:hypothetical protein